MTHSGIKDSGIKFQIVPSTRKITVPMANKVIGTVGDHNSEQVTIQCPKFIDGHDIKGCADHYVTWLNAKEELGHDRLVLVEEDEDYLYFAWNIRGNTTATAGLVSFSVHFEDSTAEGTITYRWSTTECKECEVLDSINAAVGVFELLYVDDKTLVFADHTPVRDETLLLETPGIVPSGTKLINTNGHHDVHEFASVDVAVPSNFTPNLTVENGGLVIADDGTPQNRVTKQLDAPIITVKDNGVVESTTHGMLTTHKLGVADDPDFKPEHIRMGTNVFGVTGTYANTITLKVTISNNLKYSYLRYMKVVTDEGHILPDYVDLLSNADFSNGGTVTLNNVVIGSFLEISGLVTGKTLSCQFSNGGKQYYIKDSEEPYSTSSDIALFIPPYNIKPLDTVTLKLD